MILSLKMAMFILLVMQVANYMDSNEMVKLVILFLLQGLHQNHRVRYISCKKYDKQYVL